MECLTRPEVRELPPYNAGLSSSAVRQRYGVDYIARLGSNENPFGPSPAVGQALEKIHASLGLYPDANSLILRAAIAQRTGAQPSEIVMGNGSENLLEVLCQAFLNAGDRVVTLLPSFGLHEIYPRMMGAKVHMIPVTEALEFNVDAWCEALTGPNPPKIVLLSNPSNPVGCILDVDDFRRIVNAAPRDTLLVVDEAYYEYAKSTPGYPDTLVELRAQSRPWIVLRTFSKAWGLAALRVGYGIACNEKLVQILDRVRTPFNINMAAQTAALAAWNDHSHMEMCVRSTLASRDAMAKELRALGLTVAPSAANFLFVDVHQPNAQTSVHLLQRGVIVKPWKETGYESYIRVSIGTEEDNARFLSALGEILQMKHGH